MSFLHSWHFVRRYIRDPRTVGSVIPSSRALSLALCEPFRCSPKPVTVLEIGAGTGAVTHHIGKLMGPDDHLDICEIQPAFADILEREVLSRSHFSSAMSRGQVRLLRQPIQELTQENRYDFVISGLPFTVFTLKDVEEIFEIIRRSLKPGGVFSYFEYLGFRKTSTMLSLGRNRSRISSVSNYLTKNIRDFQFNRETVFQNLPPAYARHLRFETQTTH